MRRKSHAKRVLEIELLVFKVNGFVNASPIPITALQDALSLYIEIHNDYKEYLPQFYYTAANIFNRNYDYSDWFTDDIPF